MFSFASKPASDTLAHLDRSSSSSSLSSNANSSTRSRSTSSTSFMSDKSDPLNGYLGHLNECQQGALDRLRAKLQHADLEADKSGSGLVGDRELLRFLRARNFNVERSYTMYTNMLNWRKKENLDQLYHEFDWDLARKTARDFYPQFFHKTDRTGSPVHIHRLGLIDLNGLFKNMTSEQECQFINMQSEMNERVRYPACTRVLKESAASQNGTLPMDDVPKQDRVIETVTGILDLKGISIYGFWKVKDILANVLQVANDYYPETSNRTFIINAPSAFSAIWNFAKQWVDQRTAERIVILSSNYTTELHAHVAPENLPKFLGGTCDCKLEGGCTFGEVGPWVGEEMEKFGPGKKIEGERTPRPSTCGLENGIDEGIASLTV